DLHLAVDRGRQGVPARPLTVALDDVHPEDAAGRVVEDAADDCELRVVSHTALHRRRGRPNGRKSVTYVESPLAGDQEVTMCSSPNGPSPRARRQKCE